MRTYYPSINFLRGVAALMVCLYHFTNHTDINGILFHEDDIIRTIGRQGAKGVFIFFVISGFVIPLSLHKYKFHIRRFGRFITRRWIRIEIPYLASFLLSASILFIFALANDAEFKLEFERVIHHIFYTIPFSQYEWLNEIYWTLAIEFQFYILIGLLFPLLVHRDNRVSISVLLAFVAGALFLDDNRIVIHYAPIFAMGMTLFRILHTHLNATLGWILIGLFSAATFYIHGISVGVFSSLAVAVIAFLNIDFKIGNRLGDISYSLYLIHGAFGGHFLYFTSRHFDSTGMSILLLFGALIISLLAAWLFWWIIEIPSIRLSKKVIV